MLDQHCGTQQIALNNKLGGLTSLFYSLCIVFSLSIVLKEFDKFTGYAIMYT